jgi:hypothetical protein
MGTGVKLKTVFSFQKTLLSFKSPSPKGGQMKVIFLGFVFLLITISSKADLLFK